MRVSLGLVVCGALALVVGCGREEADDDNVRRPNNTSSSSGGPVNGTSGGPQEPGPVTLSAAVTACNAAAAPTQLADAKDAGDVHVAGTAVFFRTGLTVTRVMKSGGTKVAIFTSPNLVRMFVDQKGLLLVEQTADGNPTATLRGFAANLPQQEEGAPPPPAPAFPDFPIQEGPAPGGTTANTTFNAPGANVFGADATNYYLLAADANNGNSRIVAVNRTTLAQTDIVNEDKLIETPVLSNNAIFWVQEGQRVKKVKLADGENPQTPAEEIFGLAQCKLAVGEAGVFCSLGTSIEMRNLDGLNGKTVMAASASKSQAPFGIPAFIGGKLYIRSAAPDPEVQSFVRAIAPDGSDESFAVCKRSPIREISSDGTDLVFADDDGVFMVPKK